ncbi:armadillo repeat-containing protein 2-like [Gigantopelta aegis]|uniref:armadillo repeat-containing protein 2-like n=1 Tax=Gigantopelta aegis TaxID=1735272 RepID=UPI001B88A06E|nr:armadillo repeat-containing protein 2-like [Gigantopelta aegis]
MDPKKPKDRPFYELPEKVKPSSKIINEARCSLRSVVTKRPFTPRDDKRTLFPVSTSRNPESRPPSAFSLNSRHFDGPDSRPVSGTRLSPLDYCSTEVADVRVRTEIKTPRPPSAGDLESQHLPPKPPSDPNKPLSRKGSRPKLFPSSSVDVPGPLDGASPTRGRSGSFTDVSDAAPRRTGSGSRDRPSILPVEERGVGDGRETPVRTSSSMAVSSPPGSAGSKEGTRKSNSAGKSGRAGSAGKREIEDSAEEVFYNSFVAPILEEFASMGKKKDNGRIFELAEELYNVLNKGNKLKKHYKQRSSILKAIFKLLDVDEPRVLLKLARLILAFKVSGNNLLNVCKLIFKVSRNEKNDPEFLDGNVLDLMLNTIRFSDHVASCEGLVYCVGAVKFLTGNATILKKLATKECIEILTKLMQNIQKTNRDNGKVNEQFGHILVQLAAALRNLADCSSGRERFINSGTTESLAQLMDEYPSDSDLMLYISRTFSKITLHTDCCRVLASQHGCYKAILNLLNSQLQNEDLVVRLSFVLGNLTAKNDDARVRLFEEKNSLDTLLTVLKFYHNKHKQGKTKNESAVNSPPDNKQNDSDVSKLDDVMIKTVRVIANLSINETVGPQIASNRKCVLLLLNILDTRDISDSEELILNTVATINNLSFYSVKTSVIMSQQMELAELLLKLMLPDNMEAMLEASRVFGNLTQHKNVRDFLTKNKIDEMMISLLDCGCREVVYNACGVLVNFMSDESKRPLLKKEGGVKKLIDVLHDFGREDWDLSSTVCKVLCNYSTKITSSNACFGEQEAQDLSELLLEFLDKDTALADSDADSLDCLCETWEDKFVPVGTQLLKRIEKYQSKFEPLEAPG